MCCYSELFYEIFLGCSFYVLPCEINRFFFKVKDKNPLFLNQTKKQMFLAFMLFPISVILH